MRIGIVNDVSVAVAQLKRVVAKDHNLSVAWVACDGNEAVKHALADTPDLILMDLIMPKLDGVGATAQIMKASPCAILIVTASVASNMSLVFHAMGHGALDVVKTPAVNDKEEEDALLGKIRVIGRYLGIGLKAERKLEHQPSVPSFSGKAFLPPLLLIGSSTGGPAALSKLLKGFPRPLEWAIVIVQHIDAGFTANLAKWLGGEISYPVELAKEGTRPAAGKILLAGSKDHITFDSECKLHYKKTLEEEIYTPSVDVFFLSAAKNWPEKSAAILMTGMGNDGAKGLKALHEKGWHTLVQNRESCIVFGMPKAAIELKAVDEILSPEKMAAALRCFLKRSS